MLQFLFSCWCYLQLAEEKNSVSKWMEDHKILSHDFEVLQHDHTVLCDKYQSELEAVDKLKVGILYKLFYNVLYLLFYWMIMLGILRGVVMVIDFWLIVPHHYVFKSWPLTLYS
jgi:hypothetical protein